MVAHDGQGAVIDFPGNPGPPLRARSVIALGVERVAAAIARGGQVLLTFELGRPDLPIIMGLLHDGIDEPTVAHVDGQRVEIEGHDEIVLRCGLASITLRRNGRVVIRGTHVETRASGVNRIRGGSVQVN
ncbi:MAG: hypothetical protein IAG13_24975 [Deltaproteobacteria bacterium]|nr:hypothetical protein [Nannocystaceae bacterium]